MDNRNDTFIGSRWFYAICFAGLFVVETLIALFVRDAFHTSLYGRCIGGNTRILLCAYIYYPSIAMAATMDIPVCLLY